MATQEEIQGMQMFLTAEKFKSPRRIEESLGTVRGMTLRSENQDLYNADSNGTLKSQ